MLNFFFEDVDEIEFDSNLYTSWINEVCLLEFKELSEVNLVFCSDEYLYDMNVQHLNHDYFTDIITFDYCVDKQIIGDLFISIDRVSDNAVSFSVPFFEELNRVIIHGVLHLCGYKDKTDVDIKVMRSKEDLYISKIVSRETFD